MLYRLPVSNRLGQVHRRAASRHLKPELISLGNLRRQIDARETLTARRAEARRLEIDIRRDRARARLQHKRDTARGCCCGRIHRDGNLALRMLRRDLGEQLALKLRSQCGG